VSLFLWRGTSHPQPIHGVPPGQAGSSAAGASSPKMAVGSSRAGPWQRTPRPHSSFPPPLRSAAAVSQRSRTRRRLTPSRPSPRARAGTAHALQDPPAEAGKHRDGRDFSRRTAGVLSALAEFTSFPQSSPAAEREEKHTPGTFKLHYECVGKRCRCQQPTAGRPTQQPPCLGLPRALGRRDVLRHGA